MGVWHELYHKTVLGMLLLIDYIFHFFSFS
jgi:hypothetical protein